MVLLCSDSLFCHPTAHYWTEELDTSVQVDNKNQMLDYDIIIEGHWKNQQIISIVKLNDRVVETITGYPILLYFHDPYYFQDDEYNWKNNVLELQLIINNIEKAIDQKDTQILSLSRKLQILPDDFQEKINLIESGLETVKNLRVNVHSDISLTLQKEGDSFWGPLIGGIAGGALGNVLANALGAGENALVTSVKYIVNEVVGDTTNVGTTVAQALIQMNTAENRINMRMNTLESLVDKNTGLLKAFSMFSSRSEEVPGTHHIENIKNIAIVAGKTVDILSRWTTLEKFHHIYTHTNPLREIKETETHVRGSSDKTILLMVLLVEKIALRGGVLKGSYTSGKRPFNGQDI